MSYVINEEPMSVEEFERTHTALVGAIENAVRRELEASRAKGSSLGKEILTAKITALLAREKVKSLSNLMKKGLAIAIISCVVSTSVLAFIILRLTGYL